MWICGRTRKYMERNVQWRKHRSSPVEDKRVCRNGKDMCSGDLRRFKQGGSHMCDDSDEGSRERSQKT